MSGAETSKNKWFDVRVSVTRQLKVGVYAETEAEAREMAERGKYNEEMEFEGGHVEVIDVKESPVS